MNKLRHYYYLFTLPFLLLAQNAMAQEGFLPDAPHGNGVISVLSEFVTQIKGFFFVVCIATGVGLLAGGILQIKAHRDNPSAVPFGRVVALFLAGLAILGLAAIIKYYQQP